MELGAAGGVLYLVGAMKQNVCAPDSPTLEVCVATRPTQKSKPRDPGKPLPISSFFAPRFGAKTGMRILRSH